VPSKSGTIFRGDWSYVVHPRRHAARIIDLFMRGPKN
jgi:hypothetical protein